MSASIPVAVRFDRELNNFLTMVVREKNTTKTDFIRQAVVEKLEDMYDIDIADKSFERWVNGGKKVYSHEEMMECYG